MSEAIPPGHGEPQISQEEIEEHNLRDAWREVETCFERAGDALEWAEGLLEDEPIAEPEFAEQIYPLRQKIRQAEIDAGQRAASV